MEIKKIGKIVHGQDGVIYNGYLFRFSSDGKCSVYALQEIKENGAAVQTPITSTFTLDKADILNPHSNVVTFGKEYYCDKDEFPLLYTNIYNNYKNAENPLKGVTCVYRLQREGNEFYTTLVQMIEVGFVEDTALWKSAGGDVRPYGNFAIDCEKGLYYAFTMRDESQTTRYFSFALPKLSDGVIDEKYGVKKVVLSAADIKEYFDCEYHHFIQGACLHEGKIYSVEGFSNDVKNPAAIRVIDTQTKRQEQHVDLVKMGYSVEPEMIDFYENICYYVDGEGNVFQLDF